MTNKKTLILVALSVVLSACNEEEIAKARQPTSEELSQMYQAQRPIDNGRGQNAYDPDSPALYIAESYGSYVPGAEGYRSNADSIYKIDALAVSMGGKCFKKGQGIESKRANWGIKQGSAVKLQEMYFDKEKFAQKRAQWHGAVMVAAQKFNMDPNIIHGIVTQESGYNPRALNKGSQAMGMMQIIPSTQAELGMAPHEAYIGEKNIYFGTKYFAKLMKMFKGNYALALAGYNAGPGHVQWCGDAIPPFKETQDYVQKIVGYANVYAGNQPVATDKNGKGKLK